MLKLLPLQMITVPLRRWQSPAAARVVLPFVFLATAALTWSGSAQTQAAIEIPSLKIAAPEWYETRQGKMVPTGNLPTKIQELELAGKSFKEGDIDQCLVHLTEATRKHPNLAPARLILARFLLADDQTQRGREMLEQVTAENPEYPGLYLDFGKLALAENHTTDARLNFDKAASLAEAGEWSDSLRRGVLARARAGLASVAARRGNWESAKTQLLVWLELDPKNAAARQQLGRALFELEKYDLAMDELQKAGEENSDLEPAAVTMAWLLTRKGDLEQAGTWMDRAVEEAPENPKVRSAAIAWLLQQGRAEEAKSHADALAEMDQNSRRLKLLRGAVARHLKNYAEAERYFELAHQEAPADFSASNQLALVLAEQDDKIKHRRALQLAQLNYRLYPKSAEAISTLGRAYYRMGDLEKAEQALQAAVASGNSTSDSVFYLAQLRSDLGQDDEVKRLLKAALEAPGTFVFRSEAQEWLDRVTKESD